MTFCQASYRVLHERLLRQGGRSSKLQTGGELFRHLFGHAEQSFSYSGADLISQMPRATEAFSYEYDDALIWRQRHERRGVSMSVKLRRRNTTGTVLLRRWYLAEDKLFRGL